MSMLYSDLLVAVRKEMWSSFCTLVDTSVMVAGEDEEESKRRKTVSQEEEEEERRKRLFTRKTRSSSSSLFLDLNEIPTDSDTENQYRQWLSSSSLIESSCKTKTPQNPRSEPMVYDEEQRPKKGNAEIAFTSNGASTSSSLLNPRRFEPRYNTAKSKKTETKSPPCLTGNTSSKKRAVPQKRSSGKSKKAKGASLPRMAARETPNWLVQGMRDMNGAEDLRLIYETVLTPTDVSPKQSRLLIPFRKLLRNDFLTHAEAQALAKVAVPTKDEENIGVGTIFVNQRSEKWGLLFKILVMDNKSGNITLNYAFIWDWNKFVERNDLKAGDKIRLWTFRFRGILCFALGIE